MELADSKCFYGRGHLPMSLCLSVLGVSLVCILETQESQASIFVVNVKGDQLYFTGVHEALV